MSANPSNTSSALETGDIDVKGLSAKQLLSLLGQVAQLQADEAVAKREFAVQTAGDMLDTYSLTILSNGATGIVAAARTKMIVGGEEQVVSIRLRVELPDTAPAKVQAEIAAAEKADAKDAAAESTGDAKS